MKTKLVLVIAMVAMLCLPTTAFASNDEMSQDGVTLLSEMPRAFARLAPLENEVGERTYVNMGGIDYCIIRTEETINHRISLGSEVTVKNEESRRTNLITKRIMKRAYSSTGHTEFYIEMSVTYDSDWVNSNLGIVSSTRSSGTTTGSLYTWLRWDPNSKTRFRHYECGVWTKSGVEYRLSLTALVDSEGNFSWY